MPAKKQHYVPQLHLKFFSLNNNNNSIVVLNKNEAKKYITEIKNAAEENYFYKFNILDVIDNNPNKEFEDELNISCIKDYGKPLNELTQEELDNINFSIENYLAKIIEPKLRPLMDKIIYNTYSGNKWVINHCTFINEKEKQDLSWLLAKEFIRTKHYRDIKVNMLTGLYKNILAIDCQYHGENIDIDNINIKYTGDQKKLLHAQDILSEETCELFAKTFYNHIWVLLENFTDEPFCCTDNLFTLIPSEKLPPFYGYGLSSYGISIYYPISPRLLLVMMDRKKYGVTNFDVENRIIPVYNKKEIENLNYDLIAKSYKYSYFSNIDTAEKYRKMCEEDEILKKPASLGEVG